jgi:hypothetical protein
VAFVSVLAVRWPRGRQEDICTRPSSIITAIYSTLSLWVRQNEYVFILYHYVNMITYVLSSDKQYMVRKWP